ncbi:hypothetical protein [Alsobacter sp. R-9]
MPPEVQWLPRLAAAVPATDIEDLPMPLDPQELSILALGTGLAAGAALASHALFGPVGLAVLGIGIAFVALRVDLERDAPVGAETTEGLFAGTVAARAAERAGERAARLAASRRSERRSAWAQGLGGAIAFAGLLLLWVAD